MLMVISVNQSIASFDRCANDIVSNCSRMEKIDSLLTPYLAAPQRALVLKWAPIALSALVALLAIAIVGIWNLLLLLALLAVALAAALLRPLSSGRQGNELYASADEFARRRFSANRVADAYDFVVVGAGSAGCVLARNLAEANFSVLLVESGRDDHAHAAVRRELTSWFALLTNDRFDYDLCTEVQPNMNNRSLQYGRGHVLGGSSTINALMWVLGHRADYDDWAGKHGATGWSWADLKPHFLALERFVDAAPGAARGTNGHFFVRTVAQRSPQHAAFVQAAVAAGIPANADYNSGDNTGIGLCQQNNQPDNTRVDAFSALIEPYLARSEHSNLTVVDESRVERILFDGDRASGVVFRATSHGAGSFAVQAKREVILSAGAIHTPQLLMLSGIGPAAELAKHGIRVRVDAPGVGANLQDHVACAVNVVLNNDISSDPTIADGTGFNVTAFTTSAWAAKNEPKRGPDLQIVGIACPPFVSTAAPMTVALKIMGHAARNTLRGVAFRNLMQLTKTLLVNTGGLAGLAKRAYSAGCVLNHPTSVGSLRLKSASPDDQPLIDLNLLGTAEDRERLIDAVLKVVDIYARPEFAKLIEKYDTESAVLATKDRDAVLKFIAQNGAHAWHVCGTVRMGPADDKMSPLTPDLKVKGVRGLRVVDASVMPAVPSGNTNVPSLLVGARGAEIIIAEHKKK
jgi:choline dehydrogenase